MGRIEIVTGVERRRRWSDETKLMILAEADEPGARIGEVARRHDIMPSQIRQWRKVFSPSQAPTAFAPVKIVEGRSGFGSGGGGRPAASRRGVVKIGLLNGRSLRAPADIDLDALCALIACIEAA